MRMVGLTGGIASGKSTVTAMFRELGAPVIDADEVARDVVEPGTPGLAEVARRFPGVVDASGRLDRAALGQRVFADPAERRALEAIVHPRIREEVARRIEALARTGVTVVLYDAALLIENELHRGMDGVIVVSAPESLQRSRLAARDGLDDAAITARLAAQLPLADKRAHATWVVDNGGSLDETRAQVRKIWEEIRRSE
ncbi:MAG TPA: dephospho-CoA kinase [Myxococcaceae bacterium]|nr:dephospho-CoA kinase [Myxococcaceae bacterium]